MRICLAHEQLVNIRIREESDASNKADFDMEPPIGQGNA